MEDYEKYQTFLNRKMSPFWKGLFSFLMTLLIAYPILNLNWNLIYHDDSFGLPLTQFILAFLYGVICPVLLIVALYTIVGILKEKKTYLIPTSILSWGVLIVTMFWY